MPCERAGGPRRRGLETGVRDWAAGTDAAGPAQAPHGDVSGHRAAKHRHSSRPGITDAVSPWRPDVVAAHSDSLTSRCVPQGSAASKLRKVTQLYEASLLRPGRGRTSSDSAVEAKYLTRTLVRELRLGASLTLVLTALSQAAAWHAAQSGNAGTRPSATDLRQARRTVDLGFSMCPDLHKLSGALTSPQGGLAQVPRVCTMTVGPFTARAVAAVPRRAMTNAGLPCQVRRFCRCLRLSQPE